MDHSRSGAVCRWIHRRGKTLGAHGRGTVRGPQINGCFLASFWWRGGGWTLWVPRHCPPCLSTCYDPAWIDPLWLNSYDYFSFQTELSYWCNKGRGIYPVCGMMHINENLATNWKEYPMKRRQRVFFLAI